MVCLFYFVLTHDDDVVSILSFLPYGLALLLKLFLLALALYKIEKTENLSQKQAGQISTDLVYYKYLTGIRSWEDNKYF